MRQHEFTRDCQLLFCMAPLKTSDHDRLGGVRVMTTSEITTKPVPLYLIPQALSNEIHRFGDTIAVIYIRRTVGHNYILHVHHDQEDPDVE